MSKITPRQIAMGAVILVLVILNIWRWMPSGNSLADRRASRDAHGLELDWRVPLTMGQQAATRDLFYKKVPKPVRPKPGPKIVRPVISQPVITPEQQRLQTAQTMLAQYKLVGVVLRNGMWQAFVTRGEESYTLSKGDRVSQRFMVKEISEHALVLQDTQTEAQVRLALSGE